MDEFINAYLQAALWASNDESTPNGGEPLDKNYTINDIAPETLESMKRDCKQFIEDCQKQLNEAIATGKYTMAKAGYDFWLSRNGHGSGFWDRGLGKIGERMHKVARSFETYDLYVGDDGKIYGT